MVAPQLGARARTARMGATQCIIRIPNTGYASRSFSISTLLQRAPKPPKPPKAKPPKAAAPFSPKPYLPKPTSPPRAPSPPPPDSQKQTLTAILKPRKNAFIGLTLATGLLGAYISFLAVQLFTPPASPCHESACPTGLPAALTRASAAEFDAALDWPERLMGLRRLRQRLAAHARGHVLEVAVGTGRNLAFYNWAGVVAEGTAGERKGGSGAGVGGVASFTGVDLSGDVLEVARERARKVVPGGKEAWKRRRPEAHGTGPEDADGRVQVLAAFGDRLRLIKSDAQQDLPPPPSALPSPHGGPPPPAKYDTVLQTFGICSVADPARLLANLASAVQPGTGRIMLLEHGRGLWGPINNWLDRSAGRHFERFGCWWNRDVEGIVRAAAAEVPGLEVVEIRRAGVLQFGTTLWIELRVKSASASDVGLVEGGRATREGMARARPSGLAKAL